FYVALVLLPHFSSSLTLSYRSCFFYGYGYHRGLHSFPTRRSSDLDCTSSDTETGRAPPPPRSSASDGRPATQRGRSPGFSKVQGDPCALPSGQQLSHRRQYRRLDPVVDPGAAPLGREQVGFFELLEVVGEGRLRDTDVGVVAHARLAGLVRGEGREQPQPHRVAERLEPPGGPLGLLGGEGALAQRRAAGHRGGGGLGSVQKRQCLGVRH